MDISFFDPLGSTKKGGHLSTNKITIDEYLDGIEFLQWKDLIDKIQAEPDREKKQELKRKTLPSVTISGLFDKREEAGLIKHSGFICIDIDNFSDKTLLAEDPYTYACHKSAGGNGLAVLVKIDPDHHKASFRWLKAYYERTLGILVDTAPQNVASLRFVSADVDLVRNPNSLQAPYEVDPPPKPPKGGNGYDESWISKNENVNQMIQESARRNINLIDSNEKFADLANILADEFGEEGRGLFHELCSPDYRYDPTKTERKYDYALKRRGKWQGERKTINTLYKWFADAGIRYVELNGGPSSGGKNNNPQLKSKPIIEPELENETPKKKKGTKIADLLMNLEEYLKANFKIRKNAITQRLEDKDGPIEQERLYSIYKACLRGLNHHYSYTFFEHCLFADDLTKTYHPILEYIEQNGHRNSLGNIDKLCQTIDTDTANYHVYIRKWYLSLMAALNGNPVRLVLALTGGQYTGKTEWFRRLLPQGLKKYYGESKLDAGKDDEILMCEKLILMDDEMGGKSKQDAKRFKELTSKCTFYLRAPYGRVNQDFKRLAVLCGTSNDPEIINDPTGNTRILPLNVLSINHALYNSIDKDELFMEAYRAYNNGASWELDETEAMILNQVSTGFSDVNMEAELLLKYFSAPDDLGVPEFMTNTEVKIYLERSTGLRNISSKKLGMALRNYCGGQSSKKINGMPTKGYHLVKKDVTGDEIRNRYANFNEIGN